MQKIIKTKERRHNRYLEEANKVSRFWKIQFKDAQQYNVVFKDKRMIFFTSEIEKTYVESKLLLRILEWN